MHQSAALLVLSFAGIAQLAGGLPPGSVAHPQPHAPRPAVALPQTGLRSADAILKSVADNDLGAVVRDILLVAGREGQAFTIRPSTTLPTAGAASAGRMMLIIYNPSFLHEVRKRASSDWPVVLTLAHEVSHYLAGHTEPGNHYPKQELEADELAGFVLAVFGASLEDTRRSVEAMCEVAPPVKPLTAEDVLAATEHGWREGAVYRRFR